MRSPTKRTNKTRAGIVLLSVLALVGTGAVAWGHGTPSASIPDANGTIHACFPSGGTRTLRVVAPTQTCAASQSGVDWAVNGVLTRLEETGPPALPLTLPAGAGQTGSMNLTCPTDKVATGLAAFTTTAPTAPAALVGMSRSGSPAGNVLTVTFANILGAASTISDLKAICVTLFAQ
jgi:hypothetical protein